MQIIGLLAERHGLTRYLALCTSTAGNFYRKLDRERLPTVHRLMYNCPADFEDGLDIGLCGAGSARRYGGNGAASATTLKPPSIFFRRIRQRCCS
jgi:hypothetical protein